MGDVLPRYGRYMPAFVEMRGADRVGLNETISEDGIL